MPPRVHHLFAVSALGGSELGALAYIGHQPEFGHSAVFFEPGPAIERYARAGIAVSTLDAPLTGALALYRAYRRLEAELRRDPPDLLHAYGLRPSILARFLKPRLPLVQAVHSIDRHRPPWQAYLDRETARRVDRYVTNSAAGSAFLAAERGVESARIRVVPNGIDVEAVAAAAPERERMRNMLGIPVACALVLTVANLREPKGLDVLIQVAERLTAARPAPLFVWLIAGTGPLGGDLAKELARRGLAERVRLIGFRSDVPALLAAADLFCLTSRREGVPIAILEAMAAGKAVVATDVGGVGELVVAGETGLLAPAGDDAALADCLLGLLNDRDLCAAFGRAGQERAYAHFTLERAAREIAAVYHELLAERPASVAAEEPPLAPAAHPGPPPAGSDRPPATATIPGGR
jgi:glycosyltransferase involved in cell wall biosynthesis